MAKKRNKRVNNPSILFGSESNTNDMPDTPIEKQIGKKKNFPSGFGRSERIATVGLCLLLGIGVLGSGLGEKISTTLSFRNSNQTGQSASTAKNGSMLSRLNPFATAVTTAPPQLSKEYIYAGSRMLAVEDAGPTPTPAGFESDVAPRPYGNGLIQSSDVNQTERFFRRLDTASITPNEFQRADSAPRVVTNGVVTQCGDGVIDSSDVQQARLYFNQFYALMPACGPTAPTPPAQQMARSQTEAEASKAQSAAESVLTVESTSANAGSTINVDIRVKSKGNETQFGFVLNFDPNVLSFTGNSGTGTTGATSAWCNLTATPGEIFCAVNDFISNQSGTNPKFGEIGPGNKILVSPQFVVAASASAGTQTTLSITDASAADEATQPLVMKAEAGTVDILGTKPVK
jgi:hypothetical protein